MSDKLFKRVKRGDKRFVKYTDPETEETFESEVVNDPTFCLLPPLYSIAKTGKRMVWKVWVLNNTIYNMHGHADGKRVVSNRVIEGKNEGKKNATTAEEQAVLQARRAWAKKLDKNYAPDDEDTEGIEMYEEVMELKRAQGGTNHGVGKAASATTGGGRARAPRAVAASSQYMVQTIEREYLPMHIPSKQFSYTEACYKYFREASKTNRYSFRVDRKMDGYRCIARRQDPPTAADGSESVIVMTSRTGKQFPYFRHIREAINQLLDAAVAAGIEGATYLVLDGELFARSIRISDAGGGGEKGSKFINGHAVFNFIQSAAGMKRTEPHPDEGQVEYHLFDVVDMELPQTERTKILESLFELPVTKAPEFPIKRAIYTHYRCRQTEIEEIVRREHNAAIEAGDEGLVIRADDLMYEEKHRPQQIKKLKAHTEAEFLIVGAAECKGTEAGCVDWICEATSEDTGEKTTFNVRPIGSFAERRALYKARDKYIGALLTVRFHAMDVNGVPQHGSGRSIRWEFSA